MESLLTSVLVAVVTDQLSLGYAPVVHGLQVILSRQKSSQEHCDTQGAFTL